MKKKKQKKTDAAGKYTLPAAGPGWEPSLPDPEQPPRVQRLPYRPDPEQPPRVQRLPYRPDPEQPPQVQRLPYRPDPARPPQVQLLQMQRSALPYVGRAGKNSGAANWVEKLDWKTPSGAPYTSAPEQGGPSNLVELIMAQRGGGGGGFRRVRARDGAMLPHRVRAWAAALQAVEAACGPGMSTRSNRGETRP